MKFIPDKKLTSAAHCACAVSAASVVGITLLFGYSAVLGFLGNTMHILEPIIVGFVIAYLFNPMMKRAEGLFSRIAEKKKEHTILRRVFSIIAVYIFYALLIALLVWLVVPQVLSSCNDLVSKSSEYISKLENLLSELSDKIPFINIEAIMSLIQKIADSSSGLISSLIPKITSSVASLAYHIKNILLGIILSVYFLYSKEMLVCQIKRVIYAVLSKGNTHRADTFIEFMRTSDRTFGGFITGKLLDSLIIGILTFVVLIIFNIPYPALIAVIVGITNIIPFFGPIIGAIPGVFILLIAEPIKAVWFVFIIIAIQQLDGNVIGPKIIGESTGLSSLGVIVAITVMGGIMGVPGMFIGVPLFALIYMLFKRLVFFIEKNRKPLSDTDSSNGKEGNEQ